MKRYFLYMMLILAVPGVVFGAAGSAVIYQVDGNSYEGYYISPSGQAPLVLLIHDWDGLTDYEVKRADMLAELGYAGLAKELESADVLHEMITYGGAQHGFTVFGEGRYQEAADRKSWKRFQEFLSQRLR